MPTLQSILERPQGNRVTGKVAIVTGAGGGIGRAGAILLAREGARVIVADRSRETGQETVRLIRDGGGQADFIEVDLSREEDCIRLIQATMQQSNRLDVLVNVAAIYPRATLEQTSRAFWREIMAINLEAPFLLCREAIPVMVRGGGGSIINIGSFNGLGGAANLVAYSVSKGGLLTLTKNLAAAYAQDGIRVNYVIPGWVITETERKVQALEGHDEAWIAAAAARLPTGRHSDPADVAFAMLYLASDESAHVNGTILNTDGGSSMLPNARPPSRPAAAGRPT